VGSLNWNRIKEQKQEDTVGVKLHSVQRVISRREALKIEKTQGSGGRKPREPGQCTEDRSTKGWPPRGDVQKTCVCRAGRPIEKTEKKGEQTAHSEGGGAGGPSMHKKDFTQVVIRKKRQRKKASRVRKISL